MEGQRRFPRGETIPELFLDNVRDLADRPAMRRRVTEGWENLTWAEYGQAVGETLAGLAALGVTVPVYPTSYPPQVAYVLEHGEVRVCFVENQDQLAKVLEVRPQLPKLDKIVVFDHEDHLDDPLVMGMAELRSIGKARLEKQPGLVASRAGAVTPDQLATLVYTSGTTGPPKGAMIAHRNVVWTLREAIDGGGRAHAHLEDQARHRVREVRGADQGDVRRGVGCAEAPWMTSTT